MNTHDFLSRLAAGPLLCDGGMGTQLLAAGLEPGVAGMAWNVERESAVEGVHRAYRDAGCDLITTNTFQGTRTALENHGLAERAADLNRCGAALARRVAGKRGIVLGDVGPFGGFLEPLGPTTPAKLEGLFREQLAALHAGGADVALIETMSDPKEVAAAIRAAREVADWPVVATYAFERTADAEHFRTMMGSTVAEAVGAALEAGAAVVGANCGTSLDLEDYLRLGEMLVKVAGDAPVILQPNAGSPKLVGGKTVHPTTPREMAAYVPRFLNLGVRIIGGCCGTTPAYLGAMAQALAGAAPRH
jgi:methionine synthase I (cobalamin-dependent)